MIDVFGVGLDDPQFEDETIGIFTGSGLCSLEARRPDFGWTFYCGHSTRLLTTASQMNENCL